jgi:hypothetical protein
VTLGLPPPPAVVHADNSIELQSMMRWAVTNEHKSGGGKHERK